MSEGEDVTHEKRRLRVSVADVRRVAEAAYSPREWLYLFGRKYYPHATLETVTRWCADGILPPGWRAVKRGTRFHIFYTGEPAQAGWTRRRRGQQRRAAQTIAFGETPPQRLCPHLVEAVFNRLLTVKEWITHVGIKQHGVNSVEYVYQMCAEVPNERAGHTPARLPEGWHPVRIGGTWLIYHKTLKTRRAWLRPPEEEVTRS